ncbi:hypothetical protein TWF506_009337 [Arthrobotrys conoides]|uniref:Rieske domain-containing protein n=1 Tax=Arthrobotrys conoides TaxID=74498 RepID=A0AAN8NND3_9PEZI
MDYPSSNSSSTNPGMSYTSGRNDSIWTALQPYNSWPKFSRISEDVETDVVVVGAGMAGISTAYELVMKGIKTVLIDAREVTSGETGRTSGHLSDYLGTRWSEIIKEHGIEHARLIYESHQYAIKRVGEISKKYGIECEYDELPGWVMVQVASTNHDYDAKNDLKGEPEALAKLGYQDRVEYVETEKLGPYVGAMLKIKGEGKFHPTKYLHGLLNELTKNHSNLFSCYTNTRMRSYKTEGSKVEVETEGSLPPDPKPMSSAKGHSIHANHLIMTTNIPLNAADMILKNHYYRTYCIATAIPTPSAPNYLLYDNSDPYIYVRTTSHPDASKKYLIIGGEDHKTGILSKEDYSAKFSKLVKWGKQFFPDMSDTPEFAWSGQVVEANDAIAYIGRDSALGKNIWISTGDSGNGLTHGVIASKILSDEITGAENPWRQLYSPSRKPSHRTIPEVISENVEQISKYARAISVDIHDIEELPACSGGVMHSGLKKLGKPIAVYKDENGSVRKFSAVCPHAGGIVAWNEVEKSWDCPVHGSRFDGLTGKCIFGPSNRGLAAEDEAATIAVEGS